jgi:four helix bundle protein
LPLGLQGRDVTVEIQTIKTLNIQSNVFLEDFGNCWQGRFAMLVSGCLMLENDRIVSGSHPASSAQQPATGKQEARSIVTDVHNMTLTKLPAFELYEEGSQIRRSIKSVKSNIVEGYGRRRYKQDYIRFLTYSLASCDETTDHLETLYETGSLSDEALYESLHQRLQTLGKKINRFVQTVEQKHRTDA